MRKATKPSVRPLLSITDLQIMDKSTQGFYMVYECLYFHVSFIILFFVQRYTEAIATNFPMLSFNNQTHF